MFFLPCNWLCNLSVVIVKINSRFVQEIQRRGDLLMNVLFSQEHVRYLQGDANNWFQFLDKRMRGNG